MKRYLIMGAGIGTVLLFGLGLFLLIRELIAFIMQPDVFPIAQLIAGILAALALVIGLAKQFRDQLD